MDKKKKILLIDDEEDLVEELGLCLEGTGYEVVISHDGQEGLEKVRREKPDLILLDVFMPEVNGFQVCHDLKKDPATQSIPIIILTAMAQEKDKSWGKECGADEYITKPCEMGELLSKIKRLLG